MSNIGTVMRARNLISCVIEKTGADEIYDELSMEEKRLLPYIWKCWARPEQLTPQEEYTIWLYLAGRGAGKTRSGAEWSRDKVKQGFRRGAFVARTAADTRDVMVEGESGLLECCPPWDRPNYEPSKRRITWPSKTIVTKWGMRKERGALITLYSAEKPDALRGPQHEFGWCDELASWERLEDTWDNFLMGLRLGSNPQCMISSTPRPLKVIKELLKDDTCIVTKGSTYDNRENLAPAFFNKVISRYKGTRLGRQEIYAELLDDNPDALFSREDVDNNRIEKEEVPETIMSMVVSIDPAVTSGEESADTGIIVAGMDEDKKFYIFDDKTCHKRPDGWAREAIKAYHIRKADKIIGEVNNGGDLIETVIQSIRWEFPEGTPKELRYPDGMDVSYDQVRATRGKAVRAEPISALYEQGRVHHVGYFPELEDQMCQWSPNLKEKSPDRLDALVWALTWMLENQPGNILFI